jgi:hypothetical protein
MAIFTRSTKNAPAFDDEQAKLWTSLLKDIPDEIVMAASKQLAVENTFYPALAEVRNKCLQLMKPEYPTWPEAFKECLEYINKFSWEQKDGFSHPLIEQAYNQVGGWENLMSDDLPTVRAQFRQTYESLIFRAENEIKLLPESRIVSEKYQLEVGNLVKRLSA